jgi:hypothetical protein
VQITRSELDTAKGTAERFTGDVYVDTVVAASAPARSQGGLLHFTADARTAWHTHSPSVHSSELDRSEVFLELIAAGKVKHFGLSEASEPPNHQAATPT